jgi:hypothetical protein
VLDLGVLMFLADMISAGIVYGTLIAIVALSLCIALAALAYNSDAPDADFAFWVLSGAAVFTVVVWIWASWPLKYDYHHWVDVRGKVERVSSRFISAGDDAGTNQRFVFVIGGKAYGVDDTRAALAHRGNRVHLRCKKEHQLLQRYEDDGWACRWMNDSEIAR